MEPIYLGEIVLRRRKQLGLSQQMVCEGLCTGMTLSRFEKGLQTPSKECVVAILQRLGLSDDRYYAQLTQKETRLTILRKEVRACCDRFEQASEGERQQARVEALEKLGELERCVKKDDCINRQFILRMRATVGTAEGIYSLEKRLETLLEAIRLTSPRFDLNELGRCLYSADEVAVISKIAVTYARSGQRRKAIEIYGQLLKVVQKWNPNHRYLPLIAYNCAQYLCSESRFRESLEISELGRQACIRQKHYHLLPGFLDIMAECCYSIGEMDRTAELYRSAYYIYGAFADTQTQEILKAEAKERLNLTL